MLRLHGLNIWAALDLKRRIDYHRQEGLKVLSCAACHETEADEASRLEESVNEIFREGSKAAQSVAFGGVFAEQMATLRGRGLRASQLQQAYLTTAAIRIADDLSEDSRYAGVSADVLGEVDVNTNELMRDEERNPLRLLDKLNAVIAGRVVQGRSLEPRIAKEYNLVQGDSGLLNSRDTDPSTILSIRDRAGGYGLLLVYNAMFPEDHLELDNLSYGFTNGQLARSKTEALFGLGAFVCRVDDLHDEKGRRIWERSLVTERMVSWRTIWDELAFVEGDLKRNFGDAKVGTVITDYAVLSSRFLNRLGPLKKLIF